jgi:pimeloyl-ACP methyl ester carboxylesterase
MDCSIQLSGKGQEVERETVRVYHSWLDKWDERRAQRGDEMKKKTDFVLDAELGFSVVKDATSIAEFCKLADAAVADPAFFDEPNESLTDFEKVDELIKFPSGISTDVEENNFVWAKITESGSLDQVLVVFHHWNANRRNRQIADFFSKRGITVVEIAMPYHFERSRPNSTHPDYILSLNLGRTVQSMRQAIWDGRKLIRWLKSKGYGQVSVLGMSLGSWVAGLVAAHEPSVRKASLFLTAGSFADFVWTGRATQKIRESLEPAIVSPNLRKPWGPINLENYVERLARPDLDVPCCAG